MNKFIFYKTEGRYTKHCNVCDKLHKRGWRAETVNVNGGSRYWPPTNFICSKKCQNMYMLQNI